MQLTSIPLLTDLRLGKLDLSRYRGKMYPTLQKCTVLPSELPLIQKLCLFTCRRITSALYQRALINSTTVLMCLEKNCVKIVLPLLATPPLARGDECTPSSNSLQWIHHLRRKLQNFTQINRIAFCSTPFEGVQ